MFSPEAIHGNENEELNVPESDLQVLEAEYPESLPDQARLIRAVEAGEFRQDATAVTEEERLEFLSKLADGSITKDKLKEAVSRISGLDNGQVADVRHVQPFDVRPFAIAAYELQNNGPYRVFFNILRGRSPDEQIRLDDIIGFLARYPEPYDLEKALEGIEPKLPHAQRGDLKHHGRTVAEMLYRAKQHYWEQAKLMLAEAAFIFRAKERHPFAVRLAETDGQKENEILKRVEIHGDAWEGRKLTSAYLKEHGLGPSVKVEAEGLSAWFSSRTFDIGGGRMGVVGYIEHDGKVVARSFYRSNSHGVWKYLPSYLKIGDHIAWYHKGRSEESITLPIPFQMALAKIEAGHEPLRLDEPEFVFAGTCRSLGLGHGPDTYVAEVTETPMSLRGDFYDRHVGRGKKTRPELMRFANPDQAPDLSREIASWTQSTSQYGEISLTVFRSKDGTLSYMFAEDVHDRVWIAGIDTNAPVGSTGVRKEWIQGGDLTTPAYEYYSQDGGYGNAAMSKGNYVDMYKNYISKIPIIQEYLRYKKKGAAMRK